MRKTAMILAAIGGSAVLAGCAPAPSTPVVVVPEPPGECTAANYQQFIGQKSPAITVPDGTAVRHYRTGDPVTMDLNPTRLNFEYSRSGKLVKVTCG